VAAPTYGRKAAGEGPRQRARSAKRHCKQEDYGDGKLWFGWKQTVIRLETDSTSTRNRLYFEWKQTVIRLEPARHKYGAILPPQGPAHTATACTPCQLSPHAA
jgi:hypothetical protein